MAQPALTELVLQGTLISLSIGVGIGLLCTVFLFIYQHLGETLNSVMTPNDFLGQMAVVTLPFRLSQIGQVQIAAHGQLFERKARSAYKGDKDTDFRKGDVVFVVESDENCVVGVVPHSAITYTLAEES